MNYFLFHFLPYPLVCTLVEKVEQGFWHGVAAATFGTGHRLRKYRGLIFDIETLKYAAAVVAFELNFPSYHIRLVFFVSDKKKRARN